VEKLQASTKSCVDPATESQRYAHLVKFHGGTAQFDNFEPYYAFFVDLLHCGLRPLYLPNREFSEFPDDGTNLGKPSVVMDDEGRELCVHSWYSRLYHEPIVRQRIQRCVDHALRSPFSSHPSKTVSPVTVLIPAHNAEGTLAETLDSLVAQTFQQFSVLVVDDASNDGTAAVAARYADRLKIEVVSLTENAGVAGAINQGLARITSPYIARIDADDIALPSRLERQLRFLEAHPEIDVCSTWMEMFSDVPGFPNGITQKPVEDADIKTALVQFCGMSHGASMFRRSFFADVGVFDTRLDFAEDYDLWCRGALLGKRYANLPEPLTRYRQHAGQVGQQKRQLQYDRDLQIKRKYLSALLGGTMAVGHIPEFLHLLTQFSSKEIATKVLRDSMPALSQLAQRVPNPTLFWRIVAGSVDRHLL
ncbi:MAG: glycosyltransferase, partial [Rubrivivax sp.]